ncbi:hypothetical protein ON010_g12643 [Phytophthora cinnamomi]|nr:hypothetical protein ON010_g12643 [Phytophthora cinnamomi]
MGGVKLAAVTSLLFVAAVQSVPWWGDIGAVHGVRATPLALNQLAGQFGRRDNENDQPLGFPWRALAQVDEDDSISPRSSELPPFNVLDEDGDSSVSMAEWKDYVHKLETKALSTIEPATDPVAKHYLIDIIKFHYANLGECIEDELLPVRSLADCHAGGVADCLTVLICVCDVPASKHQLHGDRGGDPAPLLHQVPLLAVRRPASVRDDRQLGPDRHGAQDGAVVQRAGGHRARRPGGRAHVQPGREGRAAPRTASCKRAPEARALGRHGHELPPILRGADGNRRLRLSWSTEWCATRTVALHYIHHEGKELSSSNFNSLESETYLAVI